MAGKKQKPYDQLVNQRGDRRRVFVDMGNGWGYWAKPGSVEPRRALMTDEERAAEIAQMAARVAAEFDARHFASLSPKQQVAHRKRRDALGRFVACEPGERIVADRRSPRKRRQPAGGRTATGKRRRRRR